MTEWRSGDWAMVEIARMNGRNVVPVGNGGYSIDVNSIRPLPPAMTDAEAALIEHIIFKGLFMTPEIDSLRHAVLVERAPRKYAGLRNALAKIEIGPRTRGLDEAKAELSKLEAEERGRPNRVC